MTGGTPSYGFLSPLLGGSYGISRQAYSQDQCDPNDPWSFRQGRATPAQVTAAQHAMLASYQFAAIDRIALAQQMQQWQHQAIGRQHWLRTVLDGRPDHTEDEFEDASIEIGEVIGWRAWRATKSGLQSTYTQHPWPRDKPMQATGVGAPLGKGIHTFKTKEQAIDYLSFADGSPTPYVIGEVFLWGTIYEFEKGYHAEFAKVKSIIPGNKCSIENIDRLRKVYGVECEAQEDQG